MAWNTNTLPTFLQKCQSHAVLLSVVSKAFSSLAFAGFSCIASIYAYVFSFVNIYVNDPKIPTTDRGVHEFLIRHSTVAENDGSKNSKCLCQS